MSRKVKLSIGGLLFVGVAAFMAITAAKRGNKGTEVRIEAVEKRDLVASVTASGQVQPQTKVDVAADISGRIVRLAVKEGQMVSRGQFLLEIDPSQYIAAVQRAEAAVSASRAQEAQAKANYLQSQRNFERSAEIKKANAQLISDEQLEQLRTQAEVQKALHEASTHQVEQSAAQL